MTILESTTYKNVTRVREIYQDSRRGHVKADPLQNIGVSHNRIIESRRIDEDHPTAVDYEWFRVLDESRARPESISYP